MTQIWYGLPDQNIMKIVVILSLANLHSVLCQNYTPVVLWHGLGDNSYGLKAQEEIIKAELPGVYVNSLKIGSNILLETLFGILMHPYIQLQLACDMIQSDSRLANGYNAIGYSQGAIFLRALAQTCPTPKMKNLISFGGAQQGVYGVPLCDPAVFKVCDTLRNRFSKLAYLSIAQNFLVPATYWHDSQNETTYLEKNSFLPDVNNEININQAYVNNLQTLENLVLVKFETDGIVIPVDSQWFGYYKPGQAEELQTLPEFAIYNRLGLDKLDREGKIHYLSLPGRHLEFTTEWFIEEIIRVYLK